MNLPSLRIHLRTYVAEPMAAGTGPPLALWYVAPRRTRAVVVVHTLVGRFKDFVNGMKCWGGGHEILLTLELRHYIAQ